MDVWNDDVEWAWRVGRYRVVLRGEGEEVGEGDREE